MRTIKALSLAMALFASLCTVSPICHSKNDGPEKDIKIIIKDPKPTKPIHRSPEVVPMQASLMGNSSLINILFHYDLGEIYIDLMNMETGEYVSNIIDSSVGNVIIPFSGEEGYYTITFTLADGVTYIGEFEI